MSSNPNLPLTPKVAIYVRVSTHWQIDKDSLQVQKRELVAYSELVLGIKDYKVFEDPGFSGKNTDRPAFQKMMRELRTGTFSHLLVWKIDRISRNLLDFSQMYTELKKMGIIFISKNEQFDTSNAIGEAMLKIILVFAELERNMTSERVTATMLSRANNGQWNGGRIPFGYNYDKNSHSFSINPSEAEYVKFIYNRYEEIQSVVMLSDELNRNGPNPRRNNPWSPTTVHKILTSVFYVGDYRYNVHNESNGFSKKDSSEWITIQDHHPAIIDKLQHERVQTRLKRNKRGGTKPGDTYQRKNTHVFAGLMRCGLCSSNMGATLDRRRADGWRPSIYRCSQRRNSMSKCQNKYISDITIGPFMFRFISSILLLEKDKKEPLTLTKTKKKILTAMSKSGVTDIPREDLKPLINLINSNKSGFDYIPAFSDEHNNSELIILSSELKKNETALNRLHSLYLYGDSSMSEKDYILERQTILDETEKIKEKIETIKQTIPESETNKLFTDEYTKKASYFLMVQQLINPRKTDYEKFIRSTDPSITKSFMNAVLDHIEATDGKITRVVLKNKISIHFIYS